MKSRRSTPTQGLYLYSTRLRAEAPLHEFPFTLPAVQALQSLALRTPVTFFVGENGSGKSTVLEAIAAAAGINPEGGSHNFRFATRASHSTSLAENLVLSRGVKWPKDAYFLRAESFYNVATEIERLGVTHSYGGVSLHEQSHGESFMALLLHRFGLQGLYLLDEPEAALSPSRQLSALVRIHQLAQGGSQFLIATHSPLLLAYPGAAILEFSADGIRESTFDELEHIKLYRLFLERPERMMEHLLEDDD